jgi:hypothetical protein
MSLHKNLQEPQFGQLLGVILKTKFGPAGLAWLNQAMKGPFFNFWNNATPIHPNVHNQISNEALK